MRIPLNRLTIKVESYREESWGEVYEYSELVIRNDPNGDYVDYKVARKLADRVIRMQARIDRLEGRA